MLRQDPTECLFQFICSSNNHISRIHGMVARICAAYGTPLELCQSPGSDVGSEGEPAGQAPLVLGRAGSFWHRHAWPSIAQSRAWVVLGSGRTQH